MNSVKLKKSLGQNFLHDKNIIKKIINSIPKNENLGILEIGPGGGALSTEIVNLCKKLVLVEIDSNLAKNLSSLFSLNENVKVIDKDVLKLDLKLLIKENFSDCSEVIVVSNTPYYISSPILFKLYEVSDYLNYAILMMQKEVAIKLNPNINSKNYNNFSIISEYYSTYEKISDVSRNCFNPKPKVDSVVFKLTFKKNKILLNNKQFEKFLQQSFNNKRKTIKNNLKNSLKLKEKNIDELLSFLNIQENKRPEELNLTQFLKIFLFSNLYSDYSILFKSNSKITLSFNATHKIKNNLHDFEAIYFPNYLHQDEILINFNSKETKITVLNDSINIVDNNIKKLLFILKKENIFNENIEIFIWKNTNPEKGIAAGSGNLFFVAKKIAEHLNKDINEWKSILYSISSDSLFFYFNDLTYVKDFGKSYEIIKTPLNIKFKLLMNNETCSTKKVFLKFDDLTTKNSADIKKLSQNLSDGDWKEFVNNSNNNLEEACFETNINVKNIFKKLENQLPQDKIILSGSGSTFIAFNKKGT